VIVFKVVPLRCGPDRQPWENEQPRLSDVTVL
jgi:hypothetical protein